MVGLTQGAITGAPKHAKKSKAKGRKIGRNRDRSNLYLIGHRFEINKCRKLRRVLKRNPTDINAATALRVHAHVLSSRQCDDLGISEML